MAFSPQDQKILKYLKKAKTAHADLIALFDFYEQLFQFQLTFKSRLNEEYQPGYWEDKEIDLNRLASGIPQVSFDELQMQAAPFIELFRNIAPLFMQYTGYHPPDTDDPQPKTILDQAREIYNSGVPLVGAGPSEDMIKAVSGLVLAPYVQLACERIMPRITQEAWHRGHCPVCGGAPSFALLHGEPTVRTLLCSRCYAEWRFRRFGCPYCLERDHQTYYPTENGGYRLYVCEACNRYLKSLDLQESPLEPCLPVEMLATVAMDVAAQKKGWLFF
jgi:hypothetical protein